MTCDLCGQDSPMVRPCAFGETGASLNLHPWCADELIHNRSPGAQDEILQNAIRRRNFAFPHKIG
jgi:hypothetical protein